MQCVRRRSDGSNYNRGADFHFAVGRDRDLSRLDKSLHLCFACPHFRSFSALCGRSRRVRAAWLASEADGSTGTID